MPRNKMPHADAEMQVTYLDANGAYAVRQTWAKIYNVHHSCCQCLHIYSRHSCSQILYWLSLQSIHLPVCVLRCPAVFLHILKY